MKFISAFIVPITILCLSTCVYNSHENEVTSSASSTDLAKELTETLLLFSTLNGYLVAVDSLHGHVLWKHQNEPAVRVPVDDSQAVNPSLLPDPKDGSLYLLGNQNDGSSLKKMPFTVPQLVASAPCRSSDGFLYTGKKVDQWYLVEPRSGQRESVLGWNIDSENSENTCPLSTRSSVFIGRTQYQVLMMDSTEARRKWNITYFDYTATPMTKELLNSYEMIHFAASSTGLVATLDRVSGKVLWQINLDSPVVACYLLTNNGLIQAPFTSIAHHTLEALMKSATTSSQIRLYPTLYIGEHVHGLYALPSLVDQNTVTISAAQTGPLLLDGPSNNGVPQNPTISGQNIRISPDEFENLLNMPSLHSITKDKKIIILLGHYSVPEYSQTRLQIQGTIDLLPRTIEDQNENDTKKINIPTNIKYMYRRVFQWLNQQENKGLKLVIIIIVGCMISMFWYFHLQVREFQQMSQGSTSSTSLNPSITAIMEEMSDGQIQVGKIKFSPTDILGRGCEGTVVYKGEFERRAVAVKRLLPECFSLADREISLLKESDAHLHVIRYHCTERDKQFCYIALELCVATLYDYITKPDETLAMLPSISDFDILKQATSGISHLHSLDIVHRDIKPQNVLLWVRGKEVRAMISDFGLCKKLQIGRTSFSRRSGVTGTEGWIAPEMLNNKHKTTTSVDIFSLGCVFYFVLSRGKHPFGEPLRRQANILSGFYELDDLQISDDKAQLIKQLVVSMISSQPNIRPPADAVLQHPMFWSQIKILNFLQDVSDRVEKADVTDSVMLALENNSMYVVHEDWRCFVDEEVVADLRKYRTYRGGSVRDLLRALRNKKHHFRELTEEAQQRLGEIPEQFSDYWTSRFPNLLMHVFISMQFLKEEPVFKSYYNQSYNYSTSSFNFLPYNKSNLTSKFENFNIKSKYSKVDSNQSDQLRLRNKSLSDNCDWRTSDRTKTKPFFKGKKSHFRKNNPPEKIIWTLPSQETNM